MSGTRLETVIETTDLDATWSFLRDEVGGFRMHLITPADDPAEVVLDGHDARVRVRRSDRDVPVRLVVDADPTATGELRGPGGLVVERRHDDGALVVPEAAPSLTFTSPDDADGFGVGRAGMEYRDLLPDRWGGRFVASTIRISGGGELDDWVHFHRIRFQMIYVAAGWVEVVYEDQGEPFRMAVGDCVLQPPGIRHRVLRASPGMEVIEVGCPAVHDTIADHDLALPTGRLRPDRDYGGQRFVRHVAGDAAPEPWIVAGWQARDIGVGAATDGLAGVVAVTPAPDAPPPGAGAAPLLGHDDEFVLLVGLRGRVTVDVDDHGPLDLVERASVSLPPGSRWRLVDPTLDHEHLVVALGADAVRAV